MIQESYKILKDPGRDFGKVIILFWFLKCTLTITRYYSKFNSNCNTFFDYN